MGNRGSYGFKINNQYKLTYINCNSGIDRIGETITLFIKTVNNEYGWEEFSENVSVLDSIDYDKWARYGKYFEELVYSGDILLRIYEGKIDVFPEANEFVLNSLFCDHAYILNMDSMNLEFYIGFQLLKQENNPFGEFPNKCGYYPVRQIGVYPFESINCNRCLRESLRMYKESKIKIKNEEIALKITEEE